MDNSYRIPILKTLPFTDDAIDYSRSIGLYKETLCNVLALNDNKLLPEGFSFIPLRKAFQYISLDLWTIAGRALQILHWHNEHQFCGKCGTPMEEEGEEMVKRCPQCEFLSYPRLTPAVIMSVIRDDKILLGRSASFPKGVYSPLAGFVEPGETLEEAVRREVMEETNIDICNIKYVASQPWPFPQSLMIGFTASYKGGEIRINYNELEDARWFSQDSMPERLPTKMSIARTLVDAFFDTISKSAYK